MPELTKQQIRTITCTEVDDGALFQWRPHFRRLGDVGRSCLTEPRALIVRPRPPGGLEPPEPKVRRLADHLRHPHFTTEPPAS